jgi:hypothetical protein
MKALIGVVVVVLMMGCFTYGKTRPPSVMAASDAYLDGYRQGSHDYIHRFIGPQVEC